MNPHTNRIVASAAALFAAFAFAATANAVPVTDIGGSSSSSLSVRPDDRAGVRGVVVTESQAFSPTPIGRGEHSFGANDAVQLSSASSSSSYDWSTTIGISAAAVALALCLAGLGALGMRQRKVRLGV